MTWRRAYWMPRAILLLALLGAGTAARAQQQPADYLPLDVGNGWQLAAVDGSRPGVPPDTFRLGRVAVVEAVVVGATLYARLPAGRHRQRVDLAGLAPGLNVLRVEHERGGRRSLIVLRR